MRPNPQNLSRRGNNQVPRLIVEGQPNRRDRAIGLVWQWKAGKYLVGASIQLYSKIVYVVVQYTDPKDRGQWAWFCAHPAPSLLPVLAGGWGYNEGLSFLATRLKFWRPTKPHYPPRPLSAARSTPGEGPRQPWRW